MRGTRRTEPATPPRLMKGLLLMLDENPTLRTLVSTWRNAYIAKGKKEDQIAKWARLAMLRPREVEDCWDAIFDNGFCSRDGQVDEDVIKYVAGIAISKLPSIMRPKPGSTT